MTNQKTLRKSEGFLMVRLKGEVAEKDPVGRLKQTARWCAGGSTA